MKHIKVFAVLVIAALISTQSFSQSKVKIGFIGNSITAGYTLADPSTQAYPNVVKSLLQKKYGDTCVVFNAGVSGRTMLKQGNQPIWVEQLFKDCWQFAPDILFIMLGTNDSKSYNWDAHKNEFLPDYISMVDTFLKRNPRMKLIVAFPPPAFKTSGYDIRDSIIRKYIIPLIDSVRKKYNAVLVNFNKALTDSDKFFPDNIHPNLAGSALMGKMVYDTIEKYNMVHNVDANYASVTSLKTTTPSLSNLDSAEITWTTMNAQSAYFEGKEVPLNGKIKVRASAKTTYKLMAKGNSGSDSLFITIDFYAATLNKLTLTPNSIKVANGSNVDLKLFFYDQKGTQIKYPDYTVDWTITKGQGNFSSKGTSAAVFIPNGTDTINVVAKVGNISSNISTIIIKPSTKVSSINGGNTELAYPNPASDMVNFKLSLTKPTTVNVKIYDLKGAAKIQETKLMGKGEQVLILSTNKLTTGVYLYELNYGGKTFSGKLNVIK